MDKTEKKFRIYGPVILSVFLLVFFYAMLIGNSLVSLRWALIPLVYSVLTWESGRLMVLYCRSQVPGVSHVNRRIGLLVLVGIPVSAVNGLINNMLTIWLGLYTDFALADYFFITGLNILCFAIVVGVYEGYHYVQQWKTLFIESEKMKKKNSQSQYQFLKEQIKPHFLFNSLNTLSALIVKDPNRAEQFVEEMSSVYRYLLSKNEKVLTTVKEELAFLESYVLMLKTRFEDSLTVNMQVGRQLDDYLLPPFVLQILIENAVKHNVISRDQPLTITLRSDDEENIHVSNNLQPKAKPEPSEHKGLANIVSRYQLLNRKDGLLISKDHDLFTVTIPLLRTNIYDNVSESL